MGTALLSVKGNVRPRAAGIVRPSHFLGDNIMRQGFLPFHPACTDNSYLRSISMNLDQHRAALIGKKIILLLLVIEHIPLSWPSYAKALTLAGKYVFYV